MVTTTAAYPTVRSAADPLCGRDILCFSHDWTGDPLSKTHLMRLLARDNRILWVNSIGYRAPSASRADAGRALQKLARFVEPIREVEPNIFVLNPLVVPAYGWAGVRSLNRSFLRWQVRQAMRQLEFHRPINWTFNPAAAVVAGAFGEELLLYQCVDEYTALAGVSVKGLAELEARLLARADLVIVSAERLYQSKAQANPNTVLVRHGVNYQHFRRALDPTLPMPADIAKLPRPRIGFFGLVSADWVDVDLMVHVARQFPNGSLVVLGKVTTDVSALKALPNVHFLGRKDYRDLPAYCKGFDVGLIPFVSTELTLNANPLKAREYLAAGLPVVSTRIPEVAVLGHCRIAAGPAEFVAAVRHALCDSATPAERSATVRHESWEARLEEIRGYVASLPPRKKGPLRPRLRSRQLA